MQLELSAEDAAFREEMRTFFTTQVPQEIRDAVAERRELTKEQIVESQRILNAAGLAVPHWPVEWGGRDWSPLRRHIWHEEMQRACVPTPLAFNASMVGPVIAAFGSQEQKERFLPKTANLDIWWCQGFSEPDAGSDLASLRTTAVRDGDEFVVNGQKTWTTLGQYGDWIFNLVRTDPEAKKQAGISFLLIDMTTPGRDGPPDRADRRRPRGQRGVVRGRPRPGREPRRRAQQGLGLREVPARQRARRRRAGGRHQAGARPGQGLRPLGERRRRPHPARRPADRGPDRRAGERAARPRADRAARGRALRRRQAAPGLVGAQAQGHRAAAGGQRAGRRPRRAGLAGLRRRRRTPTCPAGPGTRPRST